MPSGKNEKLDLNNRAANSMVKAGISMNTTAHGAITILASRKYACNDNSQDPRMKKEDIYLCSSIAPGTPAPLSRTVPSVLYPKFPNGSSVATLPDISQLSRSVGQKPKTTKLENNLPRQLKPLDARGIRMSRQKNSEVKDCNRSEVCTIC